MKNDPTELALAALNESPDAKQLSAALRNKSNAVAAKAARITGDSLMKELAPDLTSAFDRLLPKGAAADKGCTAMTAIVRALVQLDSDSPDLFLRGMKHVQLEPVWGGSEDTATDLRAVCAMGLANASYPYKLREMVVLLNDTEWRVRAGAIRAIATVGDESALLLLRFKLLCGDKEVDVQSECCTAILAVEGTPAIPLVGRMAGSRDPEIREAAILALGASRLPAAVEWLLEEFSKSAAPEARRVILLSLSTSRSESAIDFVLDTVTTASAGTSQFAVDALAIHSHDQALQQRVAQALKQRKL